MKRFVLPLAVGLVLATAVACLLLRGHARQPATFLPAGTILYEDVPDLFRSVQRWPKTALAQIINEPEVQAFLERPLGLLPGGADLAGAMAQAQSILPRQFFLAVTDWSGNGAPKTIAGLAYSGSKSDLDALVGQLRKAAQEKWPEGKSDIETYGSGEIETFTTPDFSAALAYRGKWLFIATDTALLKATLDRYEAKPGSDSLAELPAYKTCIQHLPNAPDNLFFVQPALLSDKAASLALMLNPTADAHGMDSLKKIDAVGIATAMDGEVMRDTSFTITSQPGVETPLAMDALRVSSPDTIIATSGRIEALGAVQLPDPKSDPTGVLQLIASDVKIFTDQGLGEAQLSQAFGPEMGFVLDWPAGALSSPAPLVVADVRDAGEARKFLDTLATVPLAAGVSFSRQDADGISLYSLPKSESLLAPPLQVTLGLSGKCIVGALTADASERALKQWDANATGLAGTDAYQEGGGVGPAADDIVYLPGYEGDLRARLWARQRGGVDGAHTAYC